MKRPLDRARERSPQRAFAGPALLAALLAGGALEPAAADETLRAMAAELSRSVEVFAEQPTPVYHLSYELTQDDAASATASFGTVTAWNERRSRVLDIDLRVGDYALDNTHPMRGGGRLGFGSFAAEVPSEADADALRSLLWYWTDKRYKQAIEQFTMVKTNVQVKVEEEDTTGDFSPAPAEQAVEKTVPLTFDRAAWERKVAAYTAPFGASPHVYAASASLTGNIETRWYVDTDGSRVKVSQPHYRLAITASTKADDGMRLPRFETFFAFTPEGLPSDSEVIAVAKDMVADLEALRAAPLVEPYTGPAILSGRASGVFFHEILGHRLEGHRQKLATEGQTFKKMVGEQVLPETFSVAFDPTVSRVAETDLAGTYRFDNQGVKARRVPVIEQGVLKRFLMSRRPIEGFPRSNGHGRKNIGLQPVARQSNLLVQVQAPVSSAALKAQLLALLEAEGLPFGLYFEDIRGGFTTTGRGMPNAFNVEPVMVYRVFPDGREELVRGVDLIGTPLTSFSKITAASDEVSVFNGLCGAESGMVPVAAVSPAILVSQIEVQKKGKSQERTPVLGPPGQDAVSVAPAGLTRQTSRVRDWRAGFEVSSR